MVTILRQCVAHNIWVADLAAKSCPSHNFGIWYQILKRFQRNDHHIDTILIRCVARKSWVATLKVMVTAWPCSKILSGPYLRYLKADFKTISQKWSHIVTTCCKQHLGLLPWRSRSQHDLRAESYPAHNFVFWSQILQLFLTNYSSVSNTCSGSITRFDRLL